MSYAASYALYNYYLVDPQKGHDDYSNLRLIRAFEKGLDPKSSEAGFILTHIHMVAQTGKLIEGATSVVEAISQKNDDTIHSAKIGLQSILQAMSVIEANMEKMWANSLPKDYMTYRTFVRISPIHFLDEYQLTRRRSMASPTNPCFPME